MKKSNMKYRQLTMKWLREMATEYAHILTDKPEYEDLKKVLLEIDTILKFLDYAEQQRNK